MTFSCKLSLFTQKIGIQTTMDMCTLRCLNTKAGRSEDAQGCTRVRSGMILSGLYLWSLSHIYLELSANPQKILNKKSFHSALQWLEYPSEICYYSDGGRGYFCNDSPENETCASTSSLDHYIDLLVYSSNSAIFSTYGRNGDLCLILKL